MNTIDALLRLYQTVIQRTFNIIRHNKGFNLSILGNFAIILIVEVVQLHFYPYGNLPALLIWLGCASSVLHIIECALCMTPITRGEYIKGLSLYYLALTVGFLCVAVALVTSKVVDVYAAKDIFWIPAAVLYYGCLVLPCVELLYQSRIRGWQIVSESFKFVVANWLEWLIPHLLLVATYIYAIETAMAREDPGLILSYLLWLMFYGPFLHFMLIFRGLMFQELSASTRERRRADAHKWRIDMNQFPH